MSHQSEAPPVDCRDDRRVTSPVFLMLGSWSMTILRLCPRMIHRGGFCPSGLQTLSLLCLVERLMCFVNNVLPVKPEPFLQLSSGFNLWQ